MTITLAVDGMGGDGAPEVIIQGLVMASQRYPTVKFLLYGNQEVIEPLLTPKKTLKETVTLIPCPEVILADTKPSVAVRNFPKSSMRQSIKAVVDGKAQGVISAGNTGVLGIFLRRVSDSKVQDLKTIPFYSRELSGFSCLWKQKETLLKVGVILGFSYLTYAIPFVFMNSFIPLITPISLKTMMELNTCLSVVFKCFSSS